MRLVNHGQEQDNVVDITELLEEKKRERDRQRTKELIQQLRRQGFNVGEDDDE